MSLTGGFLSTLQELTVGAIGLVAAAWAARRKMSTDQLAIKKNEAEGGWITRLQEDRDAALAREREILALHQAEVKRNSVLTMEKALLIERLERMDKEIAYIKRLLVQKAPEFADRLASGFMGLAEDPRESKP